MGRSVAWVGLGSNLGPSEGILVEAVEALDQLPETDLEAVSSLYRTAPWGDEDQPDFLNAVVRLRTGLDPRTLLEALLAIEETLGRDRDAERRWGPRRIDLDLLMHGDTRTGEASLTLPHPRLHERSFVLVPLAELDATLEVPGRGSVADLLDRTGRSGVERVAGPDWASR